MKLTMRPSEVNDFMTKLELHNGVDGKPIELCGKRFWLRSCNFQYASNRVCTVELDLLEIPEPEGKWT